MNNMKENDENMDVNNDEEEDAKNEKEEEKNEDNNEECKKIIVKKEFKVKLITLLKNNEFLQ